MTQNFGFFLKTEPVKKNYRVIGALFLAYIVLGGIIIFFDLGNTLLGGWIAQWGRSAIPAIKGTAEITSSPNSAAMLLAVAWIWGVIMYVPLASLLIRTKGHQVVNLEHLSQTSWTLKIGLWLGVLTGIFVMAHMVPTPSAGVELVVFSLLDASPIYTVFWGMTIWATVWMGLILPTIGFVSIVGRSNHGGIK